MANPSTRIDRSKSALFFRLTDEIENEIHLQLVMRNQRFPSLSRLALLLLPAALGTSSTAFATPEIFVPDEPKKLLPKPAGFDLPRETQIENPLDGPAISGTAIGGYGEIVLNAPLRDNDPTTVDVRRLVLYLGHNFTERLRMYSEIEIEHAVSSSSDKGEVEVEQAFVDYLAARWFNLRAGLVIMPVGIVNVYHEPPTFNGADRPDTDQYIIPTTWREVGAGIFGAFGPLRYQLYVVTGFDALGFTSDGLREGHQEGQLARAHDWGVVARVDYTPFTGADVGASFYRCNSSQGNTAPELDGSGIPVTIVEADARVRWKGIEGRAEFANVWIGDSVKLNALLANQAFANMMMAPEPVSHQLRGGYVELGYNVLHPFHFASNPQLVAFGRYERTNTQADVYSPTGPAPGHDRQAITFGLTYRPVAELAIKFDYQRRSADGQNDWNQVNLGIGFMF
jgi:hypothetical protein